MLKFITREEGIIPWRLIIALTIWTSISLSLMGASKLNIEKPWMTMSVYRDSVEIFMNGKKTFLRNSQIIYNRKYLITIKKLDNDSTGSGIPQHSGVAKFDR